uniref:Calcineurin-like phosphoesterase superfamily domain-containing protein n=1 Tax=Candidatus Kentrum eta TaxID=2126337 RepID=A0A450V088_9GAMM|nr:MAG: Calcineurin-like phosphoesterase superfamily domain-containing protein [Candidatus Kentron sp. H]VFJ98282.1 MAG: Calcineurin-like phosphoesterase superfamily domain-containing protein [Candidatus Kentron sp. H]VFK03422.1 MAG: Calcineurin-like phosphoesterase superfamily domain-containing protein [Candidatus Kentron sp. H]
MKPIESSTQLVWVTDPHFDFLETDQIDRFLGKLATVSRDSGDGVVVMTGDIATGKTLAEILRIIHEAIPRVFFVLGNHDAYGGRITEAREIADRFPGYLTTRTQPVVLTPTTCLMGHDGWADGRAGNYHASPLMLSDYVLIKELAGLSREERFYQLNVLGDLAGASVRASLPRVLAIRSHVILATHVPPFQEACWYKGKISNDNWAPHFSSRIMGQILVEVMMAYPDKRLTVLCGHTHSPGVYRPTENIAVYTGGAVYGQPEIQAIFSADDTDIDFEP